MLEWPAANGRPNVPRTACVFCKAALFDRSSLTESKFALENLGSWVTKLVMLSTVSVRSSCIDSEGQPDERALFCWWGVDEGGQVGISDIPIQEHLDIIGKADESPLNCEGHLVGQGDGKSPYDGHNLEDKKTEDPGSDENVKRDPLFSRNRGSFFDSCTGHVRFL